MFFVFLHRILTILILSVVGSQAATVADILSFRQRLTQASSETKQAEETARLAELLHDIKPNEITAGQSLGNLDQILVDLLELKKIVRITSNETDHKHIQLKKLALTRIRYLEDNFVEKKFSTQGQPYSGFDINSLKDGDIVLLRGATSVSAMVAGIGETTMVYSHIGIVHVDPVSGKKYLVESLPRFGVVANPIERIDTPPHARIVVYRSKNTEEAKLAAEQAFQMAIFSKNNGNIFDFDYSMNPTITSVAGKRWLDGKVKYTFDTSDSTKCLFFCSKLLSYIFADSENKGTMPRYKSTFRSSVEPVVRAVGVPASITETFLPGDFELESGFDLVHEYRNPKLTLSSRIDDAIVDEILNKIAFEGKLLKATRFQLSAAGLFYSITSHKTSNKLLRAIGVPMSPQITPNLMITLFNLERILVLTRNNLRKKQKIMGINLDELSMPEIESLVKNEFDNNPKLINFFVVEQKSTGSMCLQFYNGVGLGR